MHRISHPVTRFQILHVRSDRFYHAGGFVAGGKRRLGLVEPDAEVDVDEIHADGGNLHQRFGRPRCRDRDFYQLEFFGTARLRYLYLFHRFHSWSILLESHSQLTAGVNETGIENEEKQSERKGEQAADGSERPFPGQPQADQGEAANGARILPLHPEVIAIFINDEKLRGHAQCDQPFPFGHDRLGGADHAGEGVVAGTQFANQPGAAFAGIIVGHTINGGVLVAGRGAAVAGHNVDADPGSPHVVKMGHHSFEQRSVAALNEQNSGQGRFAPGEKVTHLVFCGDLFHVIDDNDIDRAFAASQFETELVLECGEEGRSCRGRIVG